MLAQSCLLRRPYRHLSSLHPPAWHRYPPALGFHSSSRHQDDSKGMPDHYATLNLQPNASPAEIKKSFYTLSKAHHPDLHPSDPSAPQRFVAISEAYSTLGSPTARQKYDRDFLRSQPPGSGPAYQTPQGSHSSAASSGPGGRPASGLSRRRTQFRGPPPSFYRSGGWGAQGEKRSQHASNAQDAAGQYEQAQSQTAGTGPGGFNSGFSNDVPHFNHQGHYQTQEKVSQARHRARRKVERTLDDLDYGGSSSPLFNFIMIGGSLTVILSVSGFIMGGGGGRKAKEAGKESRVGERD